MTAFGYQPIFYMPVIAPPPPGQDATDYYDTVALATNVQVTPTNNLGLYIKLSNAAYSPLFAMSGGLVYFIPTSEPLPNPSQEIVQGAGALVLQIWIVDYDKLRANSAPGVPAKLYVLYLNADSNAARNALAPHVQALKDSVLKGAWNQPSPAPDHAALVTNYLNQLMLGKANVFVPGGTLIGEAAVISTTPSSDRAVILRFLDDTKNDLSPVLHLRNMENYGGEKWHDHPLIAAVSNIPAPVDIYLQFEVWNGTQHEALPAGVSVDLVDWDSAFDSDPLLTEMTDNQGRVHFSTSLEALATLDADDTETDLYFVVHTGGLTRAGHALPNTWSTKGWKSTDGSPGYYENFISSQLGTATAPLVFHIGYDFHLTLQYDKGSNTTGLAPAGIPLTVLAWKQFGLVDVKQVLETDSSGQAHGIIFDIEGEDSIVFRVDYELEKPAIHLKKTVINLHTEASFALMFVTNWPASQVGLLESPVWAVDSNDPGNYFPDNDATSLGTYTAPYVLQSKMTFRNAALYILKTFHEWSTFLYYITDHDWDGISDLNINLIPKTLTNIADFESVSYPVDNVNFVYDDYFNRKSIAHELSHQIMWKLVNITTLGIAYTVIISRQLKMHHSPWLLANRVQALIEGWAEFMAMVFGDKPNALTSVNDNGNTVSLGPPPNNLGERVEGVFADGLWSIFKKHVAPAATNITGQVLEAADADARTSAPWITDPTVQQNFLNLIWKPLKGLSLVPSPNSRDMLDFIKLQNFGLWHVLQAELQVYNMAMYVPGITSVSPSSGPLAGGQTITLAGTDFVVGMTVEIGGIPVTHQVQSSIALTFIAPSGSFAGPVDLVVAPPNILAGSFTLPQAYTYMEMPDITSVSPPSGPQAGGQSVTITGAHFVAGMSVKFGGQAATNVVVISGTTLTAVTPGGAPGAVDVAVKTNGGSSLLIQGYTYQ